MNKLIVGSLKTGLAIALSGAVMAVSMKVIGSMHYSDFLIRSSQESREVANTIARSSIHLSAFYGLVTGAAFAGIYFVSINSGLKRENRKLSRQLTENDSPYSFNAYKYNRHPEV